ARSETLEPRLQVARLDRLVETDFQLELRGGGSRIEARQRRRGLRMADRHEQGRGQREPQNPLSRCVHPSSPHALRGAPQRTSIEESQLSLSRVGTLWICSGEPNGGRSPRARSPGACGWVCL